MNVISFFSLFIFSSLFLLNGTHAGPIEDLLSWAKNAGTLNNKMTTSANVRYGAKGNNMVDVYYNKLDTETLKPVVILIHGGAWVKGNKYNFIEVGASLARNGYVAFLPNYTLYPEGDMDDMVADVHQIIRWVWYYGYIYGGDKNRITLAAYSAGAHITALTIVKTALKMQNQEETIGILPRLERLVLISGPYNLNDLKEENGEGSLLENGILKIILSGLLNGKNNSPTTILQNIQTGTDIDFGMPKIVFYYSDEDELVPLSCVQDFMSEIKRVSPSTEIVYYYDEGHGSTHDTLMMGARDGNELYQKAFLELIRS